MRDKSEKGYHKLLVWQKAEEFGLKGQVRRAVVSVVLTIVEGSRRRTKKDFLHFLDMSSSSLAEVEAAWELSFKLNFINQKIYDEVEAKRSEVDFLISRFIVGIRKKRAI